MANEENSGFTDILSAALDESGITDDFGDDFDLDPVPIPQPQLSAVHSYGNLQQANTQPVGYPVPQVVVSTQAQNSPVVNGNISVVRGELSKDVFSQALKHLASSTTSSPNVQPSSQPQVTVINRGQLNGPAALARSASSPAIIRVPMSSVGSPLARQITLPNSSSTTPGTRPRIIKITRVAQPGKAPPQGAITLSNSTIGGKKIIITASSSSGLNSIQGNPIQVLQTTNSGTVRSGSPLQVISRAGLSGGKVLSAQPGSVSLLQSRQSLLNDNSLLSHSASSPSLTQGVINVSNSHHSTIPLHRVNSDLSNGDINSIKSTVSHKDLSRLWSNEDIKWKNISSVIQNQIPRQRSNYALPSIIDDQEEEEVQEEVDELGHAETYSDYMPTKLNVGIKHPDPVVETSSLSSVEPPNVYYELSIPESTIEYGDLSALQLEAIVYASQRHNIILPSGDRAGFLIGDGAGVGKGRTVAGIIYENYLHGRKRALWLSVSNDLRVDAERDLRDIGAGRIEVHPLNKFKYAKISSKENGSVKKGVVFATYPSLIGESQSGGKYRTRLKQLLKWLGKDFDGVIVFDECHKAKNLCPVGSGKPTKTGKTVLELQNRLPKARIVYASATGASEPRNMAYMTRLGLWGPGTPFKEFQDFIVAVEKRGVGAMELVAMDMKLRGMYIARQLSFHGVTFRIDEVSLAEDFVKVYNDSVKLWVKAREYFQKAAELIDAESRMKKSMWGQFWSAHQRFFKYLCISAKVFHCVKVAREAVKCGKCVVIGLQSTGEARTLEQLEEMGGELNDFVSTAKGVFQTLVEKHFPAPDRKKTFDIFGFGGYSSLSNDTKTSTPKNLKRKNEQSSSSLNTKKSKKSKGSDSSSDSEDSSDDDDDLDDLDLSSDSSDSASDVDDFNPFGNNSDSDDDPWLKKTKGTNNKSKVKNKKVKPKKNKKKSKDIDEDEEFDKALAAAGLLKKPGSVPDNLSKINGNSNNGHSGIGNNNSFMGLGNGNGVEKAGSMKQELLDMLEEIGENLPPNTLDHLIDELGGPENVAEMTGRKGRVVSTDDGISYESRSETDVPLEILNLTEKQRFMDGEKNIAIISEAASSGISLQADRRAINQKRRVHVTLELPWSADRAIQQFGRTHRSNQVNAPEYVFMISELAGEQRFASTVAKRLESLGALTHGDRRATESRDLSRFNFDNKYGRAALENVIKSVLGFEHPLVAPPVYQKGDFFEDVKTGLIGVGMVTIEEGMSVPLLDKDYNNISKFLNRILGMEVELQNALFRYFSSTLTGIILNAKRSGRWDMGIQDLGSGGESVKKLETKIFVGNTATNTAKTELTTVSVERGMSWNNAMDIWRKHMGVDDGFYISLNDNNIKKMAILIVYQGLNKKKEKVYNVYRPNTGHQKSPESLTNIKKRYKKVLPNVAETWWNDQFDNSATKCFHMYWKGSCRKMSLGLPCEIGLRTRKYHILSGSVLSVWSKVESVLASVLGGVNSKMQIMRLRTDSNERIVGKYHILSGSVLSVWSKVESVLASVLGGINSKMQIMRLRTDSNERIVGSLIPTNCLGALCNILSQDCSRTYTEKHAQPQTEEENVLSMPLLF